MQRTEPALKQEKRSWLHFPILRLQMEVEMNAPFSLPPFAGSMFRGVLGWALRDVCSPDTYAYLFETESNKPGHSSAPRPFVLIPPLGGRRLMAGHRFSFELRLFGQGCDFLADFVEAIQVAGEKGLGKAGAGFDLTKIVVHEGASRWVAYDRVAGWEEAYQPLPSALGAFLSAIPEEADQVRVLLKTPTRLVHKGKRADLPLFYLLLKSIQRRLESLLEVHGDCLRPPQVMGQQIQMEQLQATHQVEWLDWERKSNRQKRRHVMGGLVGESVFRGHFERDWLLLLKAGELIHLGKATTFGMGSLEVGFG